MLKVVLVGNGELAASLLLGILESRHQLVGVFRWEKAKGNIASILADFCFPDSLCSLVKKHRIHDIDARSVNGADFYMKIKELDPDVIIVGSWGEILKSRITSLPPKGCINCHPSLLPKHRGSNPYASAIRYGETETGVTFHCVDRGIDTGDILMQRKLEVSPCDTGDSLRIKCAYTAKGMIGQLLDSLENRSLEPVSQDHSQATYFPRLCAEDAIIHWEWPAQEIYNHIRGIYPWVRCYTRHGEVFFKTDRVKIVDIQTAVRESGIVIRPGNGSLLVSTGDMYKAILLENLEMYGFAGRVRAHHYIRNTVKRGDRLEKS